MKSFRLGIYLIRVVSFVAHDLKIKIRTHSISHFMFQPNYNSIFHFLIFVICLFFSRICHQCLDAAGSASERASSM